MQVSLNANTLTAVCIRAVLRMWSTFRTISDDVAFIISGMMSIDIMTDKMTNTYNIYTAYIRQCHYPVVLLFREKAYRKP